MCIKCLELRSISNNSKCFPVDKHFQSKFEFDIQVLVLCKICVVAVVVLYEKIKAQKAYGT